MGLTILMAVRTDLNGEPESEPVLIALDGGPYALLTLDDGTSLLLDRIELLSALREPREEREAA